MRVTTNAGGGDSKHDLAPAMKLVIAIVFSLTVALLNMTQRPALKPAEIHVNETASAQAPVKTNEKPAAAITAAQPKPFDAADPTTWPACAADEIVRADNGQCDKKAVQPAETAAPAVAAAPSAPAGSIESIVRAAAAKYGLSADYMVHIAKCESTLNPNSVNYNYYAGGGHPSGLFQFIPSTWERMSNQAGYGGASVFDAVANANVAAWAFANGRASEWECN